MSAGSGNRFGTHFGAAAGTVRRDVTVCNVRAFGIVRHRAIGAGGGSIAWIDGSGGLRVGPHSAGSDPGPACYGWGGTEPTVTDGEKAAIGVAPKRT